MLHSAIIYEPRKLWRHPLESPQRMAMLEDHANDARFAQVIPYEHSWRSVDCQIDCALTVRTFVVTHSNKSLFVHMAPKIDLVVGVPFSLT